MERPANRPRKKQKSANLRSCHISRDMYWATMRMVRLPHCFKLLVYFLTVLQTSISPLPNLECNCTLLGSTCFNQFLTSCSSSSLRPSLSFSPCIPSFCTRHLWSPHGGGVGVGDASAMRSLGCPIITGAGCFASAARISRGSLELCWYLGSNDLSQRDWTPPTHFMFLFEIMDWTAGYPWTIENSYWILMRLISMDVTLHSSSFPLHGIYPPMSLCTLTMYT